MPRTPAAPRRKQGSPRERASRFFVGTYPHGLDEKGRTTIPAKFRETVAARDRSGRLYLRPCGTHVQVYSERLLESIAAQYDPRDFMDADRVEQMRAAGREFVEVRCDKQGRICIPEELRARIDFGDQVLFVGCFQVFEIWPATGEKEARHG
jgi:MraZ protein